MRDCRQYPTIEEKLVNNGGNHQNGLVFGKNQYFSIVHCQFYCLNFRKHAEGDESSSGDELSNGIGVMMINDEELDSQSMLRLICYLIFDIDLPQRKSSSKRGNLFMSNGNSLASIKVGIICSWSGSFFCRKWLQYLHQLPVSPCLHRLPTLKRLNFLSYPPPMVLRNHRDTPRRIITHPTSPPAQRQFLVTLIFSD